MRVESLMTGPVEPTSESYAVAKIAGKPLFRLLADTCMPLDLYLWLAYRLHNLEAAKPVSWEALHLQFGAGTRQLKHFKPRLARDLELATAVYPDARVEITETGLRLWPSPPPVPPRVRAVGR